MNKISKILFYLTGLIALGFGGLYFFKEGLMPYHFSFMEMSKEEIDAFNPRIIELSQIFKKLVGAGFIAIGIAGLFMTYFSNATNVKWSRWALMLMFMMGNVPTLIVSHWVAGQITEGDKPPWMLSLAIVGLVAVAFGLSFKPPKERP